MAHSSSPRRFRSPGRNPLRRPAAGLRRADPARLAAVRAYAIFRAGGGFHPTAPPAVREAAQRRLYANLLRGMVRHLRLLEAEAARLARRPAKKLSPPVMAALVLGLYQVLMLQQADHAAVFETVELLGALGQAQAKGLVNAVLRAALRERARGKEAGPSVSLPARPLAERTSHPDWLVERWVRHHGAEAAERICEANNRYEASAVRVNIARTTPSGLIERLAREGVAAQPHPSLATALLSFQVGALIESSAFAEGLCYVQDTGSQLVSGWIAPVLRGRVLDACCAPGGKLTQLLEWAISRGDPGSPKIVGMDRSPQRLGRVKENLLRLRLPSPPLLAGDGTRMPWRTGLPDGGWNAVLLDVPCSATGMIRKYPELKWRKHADDLAPLGAMQAALLDGAARVVRPGGLIVYLTCSLEPEENELQVDAFLARTPGFRRRSFRDTPPPPEWSGPAAELVTSAGDLMLLPDADRMGLFAALLERDEQPAREPDLANP